MSFVDNKLKFKILKTRGKARVGEIELNGVKLITPVFMPVGTKAAVKAILSEFLLNSKFWLGTESPVKIILNNTFHLYLRPGDEYIKKVGGLHKFQSWPNLILTDSGGFQIFSLGLSRQRHSNKKTLQLMDLIRLKKDGVEFRSPFDGTKHFFTPEKVIDIQINLGSDIMMVLDVCSPVNNVLKEDVEHQMKITNDWAQRSFEYFFSKYENVKGVLFPIIQGGIYKDLREKSVKFLLQYAIDGIAIGGLSVGETKDQMYGILKFLSDLLPENKPRYLMGVGTPEDIRQAIYEGIDMFDCVLPTRLGRHGTVFSSEGLLKLRNARYREDFRPIDEKCSCYTCRTFTRAYLHHLIRENEINASVLLSLHNIAYLYRLVEEIKKEILEE